MALSARCSPAGRLTLRRRLPEFQIDAARASLGQSVVHIRGRNVFYDVADEIFSGINAACLESGCRPECGWDSWRDLQQGEAIGSCGEVNWLIDGFCGERFPAIDFAHADLTGSEQSPE